MQSGNTNTGIGNAGNLTGPTWRVDGLSRAYSGAPTATVSLVTADGQAHWPAQLRMQCPNLPAEEAEARFRPGTIFTTQELLAALEGLGQLAGAAG